MTTPSQYLGVPVRRPRVAFFELSSCEGCQLQIMNNEASLLHFLSLVEVVNFREAMTEKSDAYDIAFVEGSVTRGDEEDRLRTIRERAAILVAFGSCACFGGVNRMKNLLPPGEAVRAVYADFPVDTNDVKPLEDIVPVDLKIFGCPVRKEEVEKIVTNLVIGKGVTHPRYPVCMECKANENICLFDLGEACLGPVTRAGCNAWCPGSRFGCWGCRGPADDANVTELEQVMQRHGFDAEVLLDRLDCFGGFAAAADAIRSRAGSRK